MSYVSANHHAERLMTTLVVNGAAQAIDFYIKAFDGMELNRFEANGRIGHAEVRIACEVLCVTDEYPEYGLMGPSPLGPVAGGIVLIVDDADYWIARAVAHGATQKGPIEDTFYGHRCGGLVDPFGHRWNITTIKEILSTEEKHRRFEALSRAAVRRQEASLG